MILTSVVMPSNGKYAVSIQDLADESNIIWLAAPESWDSTKMPIMKDISSYVPMSGEKPIASGGPSDFTSATGLNYWIPRSDLDGEGNYIDGTLVVLRMATLYRAIAPVRYRDPSGTNITGLIENFVPQAIDSFHYAVSFDISELEEVLDPNA